MSKKKLVEFVRPHGVYVKGDVAGFEPEHADRLIDAKHAKEHTPPKADQGTSQTGGAKK